MSAPPGLPVVGHLRQIAKSGLIGHLLEVCRTKPEDGAFIALPFFAPFHHPGLAILVLCGPVGFVGPGTPAKVAGVLWIGQPVD